MNRKIKEYATHLEYTLNGAEKSETYHQVSQEHAKSAVEGRKEYASRLGANDIKCEVIFCVSTVH